MIGHQVPAAFHAILTLAEFSLLKCRDMLGSRCDPHRFRLPEAEGVYKPVGPRTTRSTMTIAHGLRCPPRPPVLLRRKSSFLSERWAFSFEFVRDIGSKREGHSDITLTNQIGAPHPSIGEPCESIASFANVRVGSKATVSRCPHCFRFTPESRHSSQGSVCLKGATSRDAITKDRFWPRWFGCAGWRNIQCAGKSCCSPRPGVMNDRRSRDFKQPRR
jgi:hypothetical protein